MSASNFSAGSEGNPLKDRLADWKTPDSIATEPELPIGPIGKVQRRVLRERVLAATRVR